jgi:hypothetical protein
MVEVGGKDTDVTQLAGRWEGTYSGRESGRTGTVFFDLVAGFHSAEGKVVMNAADPAAARELKLKFIEVEGRKLSGTIAPYTDPTCNCMVETTFVGGLKGRTMEGTFTTRPVGGSAEQGGTWTATRKD